MFRPAWSVAQGKPVVYFKESDTIRLHSNSKPLPEVTVTIVVPKDQDSSKERGRANQSVLKEGTIVIEADTDNQDIDWSKVRLPVKNKFKLDSLKEQHEFKYTFTVPRDKDDDRTLSLKLKVQDSTGKELKDVSTKMVVYIKPLIADTLSSSKNYELWLMTGTNFDLFDGIKAQEFFFRANTLFRISNRLFGQIAFYKNRYFTVDTTSGSRPFTNVTQPGLRDSLYTFTHGSYRKSARQTIDPLGLQLDVLFKITDHETSNFFVTAGLDYSTTNITINNSYSIDTLDYFQTSRPDTIKGGIFRGSTVFPEATSYKKPQYNLNVGFMWILNEEEVNIKAQLTGGISRYYNLLSTYETKGNGVVYNFEDRANIYLQLRMFAAYKPMGIVFGLETFICATQTPAFNFTISKAFDIRGFVNNFTPVSGLKLK